MYNEVFSMLAYVITETKFCEKKLTNEMHIIPKEKKRKRKIETTASIAEDLNVNKSKMQAERSPK